MTPQLKTPLQTVENMWKMWSKGVPKTIEIGGFGNLTGFVNIDQNKFDMAQTGSDQKVINNMQVSQSLP